MTLADDKVWFDATHKVQQICYEVQVCSEAGQSVLVLAHFAVTLSAVEARLRELQVQYERFALFNLSELCQRPPTPVDDIETMASYATANGYDGADSATQGRGRVWLGLARSFQTPTGLVNQSAGAPPVRIIVAEHHPRQSRDQEVIQAAEKLGCGAQLSFHISIDDPLLEYFSGASLRPLLEKLGLGEEECISHPLVTSAIQRAQKKIDKTVQRDLQTESIADWFKYNLPERAS